MSQLQDRIASMVHAFPDQGRRDEVRALARDVGDLEARLAALEAEAKQARDDEAWALDAAVTIHPDGASKSFAPMFWSVRYWDGVRTLEVTAPTIHAALRALRAKVEGGAR